MKTISELLDLFYKDYDSLTEEDMDRLEEYFRLEDMPLHGK